MDDVRNTVANEPGRLISRLPELQRKTEGPETTINKHETLLMKENKGHELKSNGDSDLESRHTLGMVRWSQEGEGWSTVGPAPHQPPATGKEGREVTKEVAQSQPAPSSLGTSTRWRSTRQPSGPGSAGLLNGLVLLMGLGSKPGCSELRACLLCGPGQAT